jgi:hypothetical protein
LFIGGHRTPLQLAVNGVVLGKGGNIRSRRAKYCICRMENHVGRTGFCVRRMKIRIERATFCIGRIAFCIGRAAGRVGGT